MTRWRTVDNAGNAVAEYRHRHQVVETFGGWSAGLVNGWTRRYSIGVLHENNQYALAPGKTALVTSTTRSLPLCSYPAYPRYLGGGLPTNLSTSYECSEN